jgi:iron complex transport system ATP-binding protein
VSVLLQATDISFGYDGLLVLQQVTVAIGRGDFLGLLGPNGSGKTTLLKVLAGMLRPDRGQVRLHGRPLSGLTRGEIARQLAVVPQETRLAFEYTVLEIVLMGRHPHLRTFELEGPNDLAAAREALAATGTSALEDRPFSTLSGGEKQRVIIASALAQSADLLLLDEPTASLDLRYQLEIGSLLVGLNRDRNVTVVLSTHDLNFAASLCRRLVLLRGGRVLESGETRVVLTREAIRRLYDVNADVGFHERAGHLTVVPIGLTPDAERATPRGAGLLASGDGAPDAREDA